MRLSRIGQETIDTHPENLNLFIATLEDWAIVLKIQASAKK